MQAALKSRISQECHVFGNILDTFAIGASEARSLILAEPSYEGKLRIAGNLEVAHEAWCVQHGHECPLKTPDSGVRVGGFPCQDFSLAGLQEGVGGGNMPAILAFGRKADYAATPVLTIENVENCPTNLMPDVFGETYVWSAQKVFTPADVGFPCISRSRRYHTSLTVKAFAFLPESLPEPHAICCLRVRLYMGAVHSATADCFFDPGALLDHVFHCIRRDPPKLRPLLRACKGKKRSLYPRILHCYLLAQAKFAPRGLAGRHCPGPVAPEQVQASRCHPVQQFR